MSETVVEVQGVDALDARLRRISTGLDELAPPSAGEIVASAASARAPVLTGQLAASIDAGVEDSELIVGSDVIYAGVIDHGWPAHNIEPTLFLESALEDNADQVADAYGQALTGLVG